MLADRGEIADLPVTARHLELAEADRLGVVRALGVLEGAADERDGARRLTAGQRNPAVQPPERGELNGIEPGAELVGGAAEDPACLVQVVLQQEGLDQGGSQAPVLAAGPA